MKLPSEYLMRLLNDEKVKHLSASDKVAIIMMSDPDAYTIDDLRTMNILTPFLDTVITVYINAGFEDPLVELFDQIQNDLPVVTAFMAKVDAMDKNLVEDSKVKQHILDRLTEGAWRNPDFLAWDYYDGYQVSKYIKYFLKKGDEHVATINDNLYAGLTVFDKLPEYRLTNLMKGLKLLIPFFRRIQVTAKYREENRWTPFGGSKSLNFSMGDLPVKLPYRIAKNSEARMEGNWIISEGKLIIQKSFTCTPGARTVEEQVPSLIKRLKQQYPKQMANIDSNSYRLRWNETEEYPLPEDMKELTELWKGLRN